MIRSKLGDEMTAGVGRAKIAKSKLAESDQFDGTHMDHDNDHEDRQEAREL